MVIAATCCAWSRLRCWFAAPRKAVPWTTPSIGGTCITARCQPTTKSRHWRSLPNHQRQSRTRRMTNTLRTDGRWDGGWNTSSKRRQRFKTKAMSHHSSRRKRGPRHVPGAGGQEESRHEKVGISRYHNNNRDFDFRRSSLEPTMNPQGFRRFAVFRYSNHLNNGG